MKILFVLATVDHHSLEYGPSNKNLFQTMGVFHTMGDQKNNFFPIPEIPKYSRDILPYYEYVLISVVVGTLISVVVGKLFTLFLGVPT